MENKTVAGIDASKRFSDMCILAPDNTVFSQMHVVQVFAQGHAALCKYYQQTKGYNNITLVDIGGYTVDILTLHDFKVDRGNCSSLRMGTITLFNAIREELQQENIILSDTLITDAMRNAILSFFICY